MEGLSDQIMYKLASIEAQVKNISENLTAAVHRLEDKISDNTKETERKFAKLETRIDDNANRIDGFEGWKNSIVAKAAGAFAVIGAVWAIFGTRVEQQLGNIF